MSNPNKKEITTEITSVEYFIAAESRVVQGRAAVVVGIVLVRCEVVERIRSIRVRVRVDGTAVIGIA